MFTRAGPLLAGITVTVNGIRLEEPVASGIDLLEDPLRVSDIPGTVDATYAFAAPGTGSPGFVNPLTEDGCFPGYRSWTAKKRWFGNTVDFVPMISGLAGFHHPKMTGLEMDIKKKREDRFFPCDDKSHRIPRGWPHVFLHSATEYFRGSTEELTGLNSSITKVMRLGLAISYNHHLTEAYNTARGMGYDLVGYAHFDGNEIYGSPHNTYLIQDKTTLDCIITFRGSGMGDILPDADAFRSHFCGLQQPCQDGSENCKPAQGEGSSVHRGFRDRIRQLVRTESFQFSVRPALPYCKTVNAVGHSMGAAVAELFTACVANAPKEGEYGYDSDFQYIGWTKGTPKRLNPALGAAGVELQGLDADAPVPPNFELTMPEDV